MDNGKFDVKPCRELLNNMVGVNRHPWLLSRNKMLLQNSIALSFKLSINMAFVHPTLSSDIAFNISHSR